MKTKDDFLGDYDISDEWGPAGYSDEKVEKAMDEYAEAYAKAAISHALHELMRTGFLIGPMLEAHEFFLQSFKESLNK